MRSEKFPDHHEREKMKSEAWSKICSKESSDREKAFNILKLIEAHYWRAREHFDMMGAKFKKKVLGENYVPRCKNTLEIDAYTKNWLWSNKHGFNEKIIDLIKEEWGYEPIKSDYMNKGHTSYHCPMIDRKNITSQ